MNKMSRVNKRYNLFIDNGLRYITQGCDRRSRYFFLFLFLIMFFAGGRALRADREVPVFSQVVVLGDSWSDTGNVQYRTFWITGGTINYPSQAYNYSDGRFTNSNATSPSSHNYDGVWHEQLAATFLGITPATHSLAGGTNYAFGAATTESGSSHVPIVPTPYGDLAITIDNMGKQLDEYLTGHPVDSNALYLIWGGANDIFVDSSSTSVSAVANRVAQLVDRLAVAGAKNIMVLNLPPLGTIPASAVPDNVAALNTASKNFRKQLNFDLDNTLNFLAPQGVVPRLYRVDLWRQMIRLFCNPENDGFIDTTTESQGDAEANPDQFVFWDGVHPTTAGHYWTAREAFGALTADSAPLARMVNIATRVFVDGGERASIAGFVITGAVPKRVLIRGIGPSLHSSGVPSPLSDPTLTLYGESGNVLMENDDWRDTQEAEIIGTGIAPHNDRESAILVSIYPGHYTAVLAGKNGGAGNGLIEVYDLEPGSSSTLANLSTRGFVGSGNDAMIGGLIINEGDNPLIVFRAIGPSLAGVAVSDPLLDPTLELHDGNGAVIAANDDWRIGRLQAVEATELAPSDDRESVVAAFLTPGTYTAVVRGKGESTGVALVEAYRIP